MGVVLLPGLESWRRERWEGMPGCVPGDEGRDREGWE